MINKPVVVVLGAGQIGRAIRYILNSGAFTNEFDVHCWDKEDVVECGWMKITTDVVDFEKIDPVSLRLKLEEVHADYVMNALPFHLNINVATAACQAGCNYIDFTEDDVMAATVAGIYANRPDLHCAPKCGLAPGYINYLGHTLVGEIEKPESLTIMVGALPRHTRGAIPRDNYNLSWSVDGLVNEYIRPCRIRWNGEVREVPALGGQETVRIDGVEYECAMTSGGVGSLVDDLKVPNVMYKTLRYPGHYDYVRKAVQRHGGDFVRLKAEFLKVFPFCDLDVIVVYAEARGTSEGRLVKKVVANRFIGVDNLSAIQSTTAGGGVAVLELMVKSRVKINPTNILKPGLIKHTDINLYQFNNTRAGSYFYHSL
jgi:saccharopine dehydrogenase-like NADP-dependent oxidoreductase